MSDDDEFFRVALSSILKHKLGVSEVIETSDFDEAVDRLESDGQVRLALFDLNMPGMDNWENLQTVRTSYPDLQVAVVSASQDRQNILSALAIGLHGYVYKGLGIPEMEKALQQICEGTIYVPPIVAEVPTAAPAISGGLLSVSGLGSGRSVPNLTPRQKEILILLVAGKSNKAMARALDLSEGTVKFHMAAVFRVLGASNRVEAATAGAELLRALDENPAVS
ncbi:LuxR C-terminal-related transcriptional regulator [Limimaricola soesokkakensis]|uniref:LuxR C-terminal-related transcriptional regulator n=1 Tax=Limimaricola soesokkakensis TaxID=1343159 RepID=UPI004058FBE8